jgi:hypothetical protein
VRKIGHDWAGGPWQYIDLFLSLHHVAICFHQAILSALLSRSRDRRDGPPRRPRWKSLTLTNCIRDHDASAEFSVDFMFYDTRPNRQDPRSVRMATAVCMKSRAHRTNRPSIICKRTKYHQVSECAPIACRPFHTSPRRQSTPHMKYI